MNNGRSKTCNVMRLPEVQLGELLCSKKRTIAVAESCTGGLLCHRITSVSGSSAYFTGGIIAYSNAVKMRQVGVEKGVLQKYGAVDKRVATMMAEGIRKKMKTDIGIGVTGIAGPTGGTPSKPVGLVYIAVTDGKKYEIAECKFKGDRNTIKDLSATKALEMAVQFVIQHF